MRAVPDPSTARAAEAAPSSLAASPPPRWLVLIHQLPRTPPYLRAKIGRQLARVGAVAIKNSVYVLPMTDETREDLQWVVREIEGAKAEASLFEANVIDGLTNAQIEARFRDAVAPEWHAIAADATALLKALRKRARDAAAEAHEPEVVRLRKRADELSAIDFFGAPGAREALALVAECERLARPAAAAPAAAPAVDPRTLRGRVWATRKGVAVDRIASAWLVRRFIDRDARFVFLARGETLADPQVVRFDMFGGEFTHEGDLCTFEVLAARTGLADPAVRAIGEVIHDLDLKDGRYARAETAGIAAALAGVGWAHASDEERLRVGGELFDALYEHFRRAAAADAQL